MCYNKSFAAFGFYLALSVLYLLADVFLPLAPVLLLLAPCQFSLLGQILVKTFGSHAVF